MKITVQLHIDYGEYKATCIQLRLEREIREEIADTVPDCLQPKVTEVDGVWDVTLDVGVSLRLLQDDPESLEDALYRLLTIERVYSDPEKHEQALEADNRGIQELMAWERNEDL